jgi:hypothetical protein
MNIGNKGVKRLVEELAADWKPSARREAVNCYPTGFYEAVQIDMARRSE